MTVGDRPLGPGMSEEPPGPQGADVAATFRKLLHGAPSLLLCAILGGGCGYMALRLLPETFTSSASLLIDPRRPGAIGADAAFTNLYVDSGKLASVELILLSAQLLERVVQSEHLAQDPVFSDAPASLPRQMLAWLLPRHVALTPAALAAARQARALARLANMIRTTRIGITYVIRVDVTAPSAALAQRLNSALTNAYMADQLEVKIDAARRDGQWLAAGLETLRRDLTDSENQVEIIRRRYGLAETDGTPGSNIDRQAATEANAQLAQAQGEVAASGAVYGQALRASRGGHPEDLPEIAGASLIANLRREQADLDRRVSDLAARYTPLYRERITAEIDKRGLDAQMALAVQHMIHTLGDQYQIDLVRRDTLQRRLAGLVSTAGSTAAAEGRVKLQQVQRSVQAYQAAYTASFNRLRDVQQQQTHQDAEARVISAPDLPENPSAPKPALLLGGGLAFGVLLGGAALLSMPYPRPRVDDVTCPQTTWSLPVLAVTPFVARADLIAEKACINLAEYVAINPSSPFADSLRLLRMALRLTAGKASVVQFTSAMPGEGKSTLATSLAMQAAAAGLRTILVDLDGWKPAVSTLLNLPPTKGVADVLAGGVPVAAAIQRHATMALDILAAGTAVRHCPDAMASRKMTELMASLRSQYDLIVLDSPPVLAVADAILITTLADATLLVCAWRATTRDTVGRAIQMLRAAGAPLAGVVINKAPRTDRLGYTAALYASRSLIDA